MRITILGAGNIGMAAAMKWREAGHTITFGVRDVQSQKAYDAVGEGFTVLPFQEAMVDPEVVLFAVPFAIADEVVKAIRSDWENMIIIDATNPVNTPTEPFDSAAEAISAWTGGEVVKAFNTTGVANMRNPNYGDKTIETFICGDDEAAKKVVTQLAEELGFIPVDAGSLEHAAMLENLAKLWITLAYKQGKGPHFAFTLLHRQKS
ncbi:MAG: NAD(P)-binding domain-containing protein [Chitinophagales bacterium]|nr:NAD(P)-binding domain-containing protein [Chitinophagales bacterium]HAE13957.1 F420-dependent NADP oxidoreductase [Bacteroidota bacterium]MCB9019640.1 NAD(P)-binding domain-containing protein [Chitinophagales bacterium]MCB9021136.1 NAD(P)-binding domain-containing protein [Chitinophagales bacterium]HPE96511.1 NAD(P)-binding domain-containing protein [Chitinophagales bacterium]